MNNIQCEFEPGVYIEQPEEDEDYKEKCEFDKKCKGNFTKKFRDKHMFRYSLEYKLHNKTGKNIVFILMNPSFADTNYLDKTLYNIKKFLEKKDKEKIFNKFIVLNLFPIRKSKSKKDFDVQMEKYEEIQNKNDQKILKVLSNEKINDVFLAWGGKYHYIATKKEWFKKLQERVLSKNIENIEIYAYLNNDGTPRHFSLIKEKEYKPLEELKVELANMPIFETPKIK